MAEERGQLVDVKGFENALEEARNKSRSAQNKFNFEGKYDIVKFIKLIQKNGIYVVLRIGPFIEAEWNFGGFPVWLREIPGITFRADEENFKFHMKQFTEMIIKKMKNEKLFASQGGPIILAQIENEYNNIQLAYKSLGTRYVEWAGNMAVGMKTGVPWVMCKQKDAPDPVIFDTGSIMCSSGSFQVCNVKVFGGFVIHIGSFAGETGEISVGDKVTCKVDYDRRALIAPNHTCSLHNAVFIVSAL